MPCQWEISAQARVIFFQTSEGIIEWNMMILLLKGFIVRTLLLYLPSCSHFVAFDQGLEH